MKKLIKRTITLTMALSVAVTTFVTTPINANATTVSENNIEEPVATIEEEEIITVDAPTDLRWEGPCAYWETPKDRDYNFKVILNYKDKNNNW